MQSRSKEYEENGYSYKITVEYGIDYAFAKKCNQDPYFTITGNIDYKRKNKGKWEEHSGGCIHDEIEKHFPELAYLLQWHLTGLDGPIHYIANSQYHWDCANGVTKYGEKEKTPQTYLDYFKSAVVFGEVKGDTLPDTFNVVQWLKKRKQKLMDKFLKVMEEIGALKQAN